MFYYYFSYKTIDADVGKIALKKLTNHLWYLGEELVGLSFYDKSLSVETLKKMVASFKNNAGKLNSKKKASPSINIATVKLEDFVSTHTKTFFEKMQLPTSFMDVEVADWMQDDGFLHGLAIVKNLQIVNDIAERGVALISEFNSSTTRNEEQKQYLLQVVAEHRKNMHVITKNQIFLG